MRSYRGPLKILRASALNVFFCAPRFVEPAQGVQARRVARLLKPALMLVDRLPPATTAVLLPR